jgi:hypothetical protein
MKEEDVAQRRDRIKELLGADKTIISICGLLGISRATFYRDLEEIKRGEEVSLKDTADQSDTKTHKRGKNVLNSILERLNKQKFQRPIKVSQKFRLCITKDVVLFSFLSRKCLRSCRSPG